MEEFFKSPWSIAIFMGIISIAIALWKKKGDDSDDVWEHINNKVDKKDFHSTAKRMGKQIDDQDEEIVKLGKGLAFIVGRMGGDYEKVVK